MSGNTIFATISVAVFITVGLGAALAQFGLMVFFLMKWGPVWVNDDADHVVFFLSDMFVFSPGLAYAWAVLITPSVAIAGITISTSIARDRVYWNAPLVEPTGWHRPLWSHVGGNTAILCRYVYRQAKNPVCHAWGWVFIAQLGLMLLIMFDLHNPNRLHYVGVCFYGSSGVVLNLWVLYLDYGVDRSTWHPFYQFDRLLVLTALTTLAMFVFGDALVSASAEWVVLLLMVTLHTLLPVRGARVVLSAPSVWHNSFLTPPAPQRPVPREDDDMYDVYDVEDK
jgi:hypothetical protein